MTQNATNTSNPIVVNEGGTGTVTLIDHGILIGSGTDPISATGAGNAGQLLRSAGASADPDYTTWTISDTTAQGDIPYSSAANVVSMLTKDANATRYICNSGADNNPVWAQITLTNGVTGILPVANGGTGIASPTDHVMLVGSGASAMTELGVATDGQLIIGSTGADPVLGTITAGTGLTETLGTGTFQLDCDIATSSTIGVSTFDENDFLVTAGDVILAERTRNIVSIPGGYVENLGITYSGSVLSVTGATAALSATNPAFVVMQDKSSPGLLKQYEITAAQGFLDDTGASEIIGNLFGLTTSVAHANAIPFFIYAVTNDAEDEVAFMISRVPGMTTSPVLAEIGAPDDAVADNQFSFFSFDNIDETLYDENPCLMIGSFRMAMSASDDWTVQALADNDGIGMFQKNEIFTMSAAQFGAASGKYFKDNGGTAPGFVTSEAFYMVLPEQSSIQLLFSFGQTTVEGIGAVGALLAVPYEPRVLTINFNAVFDDSSAPSITACYVSLPNGGTTGYLRLSGAASDLTNNDFDSQDDLRVNVIYPMSVA